MSVRILIGDCRERLVELEAESVDSCVCDPPYHLASISKRWTKSPRTESTMPQSGPHRRVSRGFMGQTWDGGDVAFDPATWEAVFRVLKPGAHLIAFSGTRTYHRMVCAIEAAGFEVRDMLSWNFGSGFPKSHNVTKRLADSGLACSCPTTRVSHHHVSDENLRDLQRGLDACDKVPGRTQSDVRTDLLSSADRQAQGGAEGSSVDPVRHLRDDGSSAAVASGEVSECLLQRVVSLEDVRGSTAPHGREHEGAPPRTSVRAGQPGVEGRGLPQAGPRQLSGRSLCESNGAGQADGESGRLHSGASGGDDAHVRLSADAHGSGEPQGPRSLEQSSEQPGTLANECGPQAWGGWPVCPGCLKPIIPEGLGTALKPAHEPICLARKPLCGTVAANVLQHGTGAINVDGCRVEATDERQGGFGQGKRPWQTGDVGGNTLTVGPDLGRWPANILHDGSEEVLAEFERQSERMGVHSAGARSDGGDFSANDGIVPVSGGGVGFRIGDSGSAARFFYCAKAASSERGEGNKHPTVKPVDLMRWLCRLVTPKGGTVLDPFAGSGSTLIAADREQFNAIGIELSEEYAAIARGRLSGDRGGLLEAMEAAE